MKTEFKFLFCIKAIVCVFTLVFAQPLETFAEETVYVSSTGNDKNAGTKNEPMKTIAAALEKGNTILLRCGDVFYENVSCKNVTIDSYGKGEKPVISGLKSLKKNSGKWEEGKMVNGVWQASKGTNIWRILLSGTGFTGRTTGSSTYFNNIGIIVNDETGDTYGKKCEFLTKEECVDTNTGAQRNTYLQNNFDFYQTSKYTKLTKEDFNYLYVYLDHSPEAYNLSFSTYGSGFSLSKSTVKNVKVQGFACHGFACGGNVTITGCEIDLIGGALQVGYTRWVRYGNGVEFYIATTRSNGYVAGNIISRTFDCAATIQCSGKVGAYPENIVFEKNLIKNCRQAFEYFLNNKKSEDSKEMMDCIDCAFQNNICINSGNNGFQAPEVRDTHLLSYHSQTASSIVIKDNVFLGGKGWFTASHPTLLNFTGNVYYHTKNVILWSKGWRSSEMAEVTSDDCESVYQNYSKQTNDTDTKFVLVDDKKLAELESKYVKEWEQNH